MAFIEIRNLSKIYGKGENEVRALDDVSLEIEKGEFIVILGKSGAGKSTLLNVLGGMDRFTSGTYIVDGVSLGDLNDKGLGNFRREKIGFVFQFYNLMPNLTALENVQFAQSVKKDSLDSKLVLEQVGLDKRLTSYPSNLSGGEQQRVSIARALVKNPALLLCDEPTGALDSKTGSLVLKTLKDIVLTRGQTAIIVTHNAEIAKIAHRIIKISDGKIISDEKNEHPLEVDEIKW